MPHLTADGWAAAAGALLVAGAFIGWGAGRAWQRASFGLWWLRSAWSYTRYALGDAIGTVILGVLVIAAIVTTVWLLAS